MFVIIFFRTSDAEFVNEENDNDKSLGFLIKVPISSTGGAVETFSYKLTWS